MEFLRNLIDTNNKHVSEMIQSGRQFVVTDSISFSSMFIENDEQNDTVIDIDSQYERQFDYPYSVFSPARFEEDRNDTVSGDMIRPQYERQFNSVYSSECIENDIIIDIN